MTLSRHRKLRFFITGHTGFKGSWLTMLLNELGHEVSGISLEPVTNGLFRLANLEEQISKHYIGDIRDRRQVEEAVLAAEPDVAIHMAAQPLVLESYGDPLKTYTTNVDGTRNFLDVITNSYSPKVSLIITTDKVYRDDGIGNYDEKAPLGGKDPYSSSKAMADILTQSWAQVNPSLRIHVARAGNVIGGFDVSKDRLLPDIIRSIRANQRLIIKNPSSVRPWQHVLDCLNGYLKFIEKALEDPTLPIALNFGPNPSSVRSVAEIVEEVKKTHALDVGSQNSTSSPIRETHYLTLNSDLAKNILRWENLIDFHDSIKWTLDEVRSKNPAELAHEQVKQFLAMVATRDAWITGGK
jgi:CDP-glucose 4,6-dehydratase